MKEMRFQIEINASREKVWSVLWQDETFRQWAGIIDPGTHLVGELEEGSEVQFISANGYGVTSLVDKIVPNEYVLFRHEADTQDMGKSSRDDQWTGGKESHLLMHKDGVTTLTMTLDVPPELEKVMGASYPKALQRIKQLAETN